MEKQFIPYELALELKKLGFNEECFGCYAERKELIIRIGDYRSFSNNNLEGNIIANFNDYKNNTISSPLWQQAFDWFRDKYNLHSYIYNTNIQGELLFHVVITSTIEHQVGLSRIILFNLFDFNTYEEARLECLKKLINIIK